MSEFNFGIKIGAENDTKSGVSGALSGIRSFTQTIAKPITIPIRIGKAGLGAARSSLAFLRDFNLGVGGLARGAAFAAGKLDELLDAGLKFKPQLRSFESLTGSTGKNAIDMAKSLVAASNGTLTLANAIQIANRGLASDLRFDQIGTVLDFVSKKAVTTGKNAGQAVDTVVTGLARGSTLFLDDFGILVDGLEGVKRTYDSIKGEGAFDSLGPAAQKAETVRQALVEMRQQVGKIGVTGKETFFVFEGIKNSLRSSVTRMLSMVANSDALRNVLVKVQSIVQGITQHFEGGGGFTELLFGKKGGKGGGLLGLAGSVMIDMGKLIGQGFIGVALKGFTTIFQGLPKALRFFKDTLVPGIVGMFVDVGKEIGGEIRTALEPIADDIRAFIQMLGLDTLQDDWTRGRDKIRNIRNTGDAQDVASDFWFGVKSLFSSASTTSSDRQIGMLPATSHQGMLAHLVASSAMASVEPEPQAERGMLSKSLGWLVEAFITDPLRDLRVPLEKLGLVSSGSTEHFDGRNASLAKVIGDVSNNRRIADAQNKTMSAIAGDIGNFVKTQSNSVVAPLAKALVAAQVASDNDGSAGSSGEGPGFLSRMNTMADGVIDAIETWSSNQFIVNLDKAADNLLDSAVAFKRTRAEFAKFGIDFGGKAVDKAGGNAAPDQPDPDAAIPLTQAARRKQRHRIGQINHQLGQIAQGNLFARQQARARTNARVARLREEGRDVRPSDVRRIAQEEFNTVVRELSEPLRQERDEIQRLLQGDRTNRSNRNFPPDDMSGRKLVADETKKQTVTLEKIMTAIDSMTSVMFPLLSSVAGYSQRLQNARR